MSLLDTWSQAFWNYCSFENKFLRNIAIQVLKNGPIPKHLAIIMDGNRRWARQRDMKKQQGHIFGFEAFERTLEWSLELGIKILTVYAFSIENFNRPADEVNLLFDLAKKKLLYLISQDDLIDKYQVKIQVLGDLSLIQDKELLQSIDRIVTHTKSHKSVTLNICFVYTSRHEIVSATAAMAQDCIEDKLVIDEITEAVFEKYLDCSEEPGLLIRTSGENRLSDFLLWQTSFSCTVFLEVLWPDISFEHLYYSLIVYQRNLAKSQERRQNALSSR